MPLLSLSSPRLQMRLSKEGRIVFILHPSSLIRAAIA